MDASRSPTANCHCPGCGKSIDPLRAGHVAIVDGAFRYFCGAGCKSLYADVSSKRGALDAMTADPPPVASSVHSAPIVISGLQPSPRKDPPVSTGRAIREEEAAPSSPRFPSPSPIPASVAYREARAESTERAEPSPASSPSSSPAFPEEQDEADHADDDVEEAYSEAPPSTLRSPAPSRSPLLASSPVPAPSSPSVSIARYLTSLAPIVGIGAGVLSAVVSLAGDAASEMRLPLALAASFVLVVQNVVRPRDRSEPSSLVTTIPIVIAAAVAVVTRAGAASSPRVEAYASFVGLAAAGALLVDFLLARARRDVEIARARDAAGLSVRVRLVGAGDETEDVDASQVKPGEQVLVEPGETIGVDGIVTAGKAEVVPFVDSPAVISKREGDAVVAGASVVSGRLRVRATFTAGERAWVRLTSSAARVEVAAPLVVVGRRMVERGVPVAALVVAGATYANNGAWPDVVIAACAGAFGLSAVAAVAASALAHARGHVAAQRRGIVYKDAGAFDVAARADVAVVCSRGTILLGEPEIVVIEAVPGKEVDRVLSLAAGAEMAAGDALAAAVLGEARARGVRPENVRSALVSEGLGVTALVQNGDKVIVGSRAFLLKEKVSVAVSDARVSELEAQGRSVLLVALGGRLVGLLALQDGLRPGARAAVQRLHDARIEPVLLSGEARETCETIARALDIEHVRPEILPSDRGAEVRALADGGHIIAAIGHAASDDGALGSADVSVAMGAAGSAPGEWGVALASDDVRDAALALTVPRACRERAKSAVLVGGGAQAISLLGIAFGIAPPVFAPVMGVLAAACVLAIVREPTQTLPVPVSTPDPAG